MFKDGNRLFLLRKKGEEGLPATETKKKKTTVTGKHLITISQKQTHAENKQKREKKLLTKNAKGRKKKEGRTTQRALGFGRGNVSRRRGLGRCAGSSQPYLGEEKEQ